jgi:hypothetical protein
MHLGDLNAWLGDYESGTERLYRGNENAVAAARAAGLEIRHQLLHIRSQLMPSEGGIDRALHQTYIDRITPDGKSYFHLDDIIFMTIAAAASGIIGNLAYDALKCVIKRISKEGKPVSDTERLVTIVRPSDYEFWRVLMHDGRPPRSEVDEELIRTIEQKYNLPDWRK